MPEPWPEWAFFRINHRTDRSTLHRLLDAAQAWWRNHEADLASPRVKPATIKGGTTAAEANAFLATLPPVPLWGEQDV